MRTLALIPARSGSKGLPGKNIRPFCGKPLLAWAVEIGLETCDETFVSTDSDVIGGIAEAYGARPIYRSSVLATDQTPMVDVVRDAARWSSADVVVLLQPTSPLRTVDHVEKALGMLVIKEADSIVSVVQVPPHCSPDYVGAIKDDGRITFPPTTRRQDTRPAYYRDGTVYVTRTEFIREGSLYGHRCIPMVIPANESATIDTEEDWQRAEAMMKVTA